MHLDFESACQLIVIRTQPNRMSSRIILKMVHFFIRHSNSVANHSYTLDFPYSITNWPCHTIEARNAIEELIPDYRVIPILAYEFEGGLMYPQWYKQMLSDALVELHFTLTHYTISDKNSGKAHSDVYVPELYSMRVLRKPLPAVVSPRKCKISTIDPMDSPTKKTKRSL